jgi:hypothetical protein
MRRFEIHVVDEAGDAVIAGEGCQFNGGLAAICWAGNPYVLTEMTSDIINFIGTQIPGTVVWIDKDMSILSPPDAEEDHGKHALVTPEDEKTSQQLEHFFAPPDIDD